MCDGWQKLRLYQSWLMCWNRKFLALSYYAVSVFVCRSFCCRLLQSWVCLIAIHLHMCLSVPCNLCPVWMLNADTVVIFIISHLCPVRVMWHRREYLQNTCGCVNFQKSRLIFPILSNNGNKLPCSEICILLGVISIVSILGMTKYRKGPTKDRKGALHRTTIMRKLPDLQQCCLI